MKAGLIAVGCLGVVYIFIASLGATSVEQLGILDTGGACIGRICSFIVWRFRGYDPSSHRIVGVFDDEYRTCYLLCTVF